ncbi:MAG TPA: isoprenylcysteine carboxylmethyltransferase family protein [Acidobacteriaceae bacterium]|nr:isoprenylcysteine carboxylmethyltransferase family protein [Acidobacteriaceae bacterium]
MDWSNEAWRVIDSLWLVLCIVWGFGMLTTKQTVRQQTVSSRFWQMGIIVLGFWMLFTVSIRTLGLNAHVYEPGRGVVLAGIALTAAGIAFAIWSRLTLGGNWSGTVTLKAGHALVQRGPYRWARHPIYTGLLLASVGTAVVSGSLHSLMALPVIFFGLWLKMATEENLMVQTFGVEYVEYMRRVKALAPYLY